MMILIAKQFGQHNKRSAYRYSEEESKIVWIRNFLFLSFEEFFFLVGNSGIGTMDDIVSIY